MIHVRRCPHKGGRGNEATAFYVNGEPQIYCYGWKDETEEYVEECKRCQDFIHGTQIECDYLEAREKGIIGK